MLTEPVVVIAIVVLTLALALTLLLFLYCKTRKSRPGALSPSTIDVSDINRLEEGGSGPGRQVRTIRKEAVMKRLEVGNPRSQVLTIGKEAVMKRLEEGSGQGEPDGVKNLSRVHRNPSTPRCFTLDEVRKFTKGFSVQLGQGGFGTVYRGFIATTKEKVAVKRLDAKDQQGERGFQAEVENLGRARHEHVVSLVGYCSDGSERFLVYELVPNDTLRFHLHGDGQPLLDWSRRLKIALGSAEGLAYLHEGCTPKIVHRDIKPTNILVDSEFEAKIGDFGLAKCISQSKSHVSTFPRGTPWYLDPEYCSTRKLTVKSDIYSFGVVLLELITGRKPQDSQEMSNGLVDWARPQLKQALKDGNFDSLVDPKLQNNYDVNEMACMVACADACVDKSVGLMSKVVQALKGDLPVSAPNDRIISRLNELNRFLTRV